MARNYKESRYAGKYPSGKYKYEYLVECRVCEKEYWTSSWPKEKPRCQSCAGKQTYTPAKVERKDIRKRGDGYITKQGYHLVYDGERYVPAHRLAFPDLPDHMVVHHIDGDKLNNTIENLVPLSKRDHREAHGRLEKLSYKLIQAGLITYDRESNDYIMTDELKNFVSENTSDTETEVVEYGRVGHPLEGYMFNGLESRNERIRT